MMRTLISLLAFTVSAHALTFTDGYAEGWAERHGPQFFFNWSMKDIVTIRRALDKLEEDHLRDRDGIDDYLMGRRARIIEKLDTNAGIVLGGDGAAYRWMSLSETTLVGIAVSRDRYCRPEDQDVGDLEFLAAGVDCYVKNRDAVELFDRIKKTEHASPGGSR
jgi:hypothetical protein